MGHNQQEQITGTAALRAVVYVRISDDPEGTERGVDRQEADCRAYATAHGWEVVAVFKENDTSAFKQRTITLPSGERVRRVIRPEFRAMLKHLGPPPSFGPVAVRVVGFRLMGALPSVVDGCEVAER